MRRGFGWTLLAAVAMTGWMATGARIGAATATAQSLPAASGTRLILLGTAGGPGARLERSGIASLLVADGTPYLIDSGDGVTRQLVRVGFEERDIRTIFLTHLHDDHTAGLPALASFAYTIPPRPGAAPAPVEIMGPPGTGRLVDGLLSFLQVSAEIRMAERPRLPAPGTVFRARELPVGEAYADPRVKVTAIENSHFHLPGPAANRNRSYSYRFETRNRTIVFTGDTGPSDRLRDLARGADILVAEMVTPAEVKGVPPQIVQHMLAEHLTPPELGKLARDAGVKTLVLSHIGAVGKSDVAAIRKAFAGRILIGRDLLEL